MKYSVSFAVGVSLTLLGFGYYCGELNAMFLATAIGLSVVAIAAALVYRFLWEHITLTVLTWLCGAGVLFFGMARLSDHREIIAISWVPLLFLLLMTFYSLTYPTLKQNETRGIKTHYTLTYNEVWTRTHIFFAVINTAFLPPTLFAALHGGYFFKCAFSSAMLLAPMLIAAYYSCIIGKRYEKQRENDILEERKREIEKRLARPEFKGEITMSNVKPRAAMRDMTMVAIFAAFMCLTAPWTVPVGPIPITLATFSVYLVAATLGWKKGASAVAVYLMLGFIGLPVFTYFTGGIQKLVGATGGYLVGYIPMAMVGGLFADKFKKAWAYVVGMVLGTAVLYTLGTAWYCIMSGSEIIPAILACVTPFLVGDAIKIACATLLASRLRPIAERYA